MGLLFSRLFPLNFVIPAAVSVKEALLFVDSLGRDSPYPHPTFEPVSVEDVAPRLQLLPLAVPTFYYGVVDRFYGRGS